MSKITGTNMITLNVQRPIWNKLYTVSPLVVIGTKQHDGYDLAPKHMAMPIGWQNYFGFVCTPKHSTYHNAKHYGAFTVSFPKPDQVVEAGLTASPRCDTPGLKPILSSIETSKAEIIDGVFMKGAYLTLECNVDRIIDGFGENSLIVGEIVAAKVSHTSMRTMEEQDPELIERAPLLAYLSPNRYAVISSSEEFPFPDGFQK